MSARHLLRAAPIGADESFGPVGRCALLIMRLQGCLVVSLFIAEQLSKRLQAIRTLNQSIPIIVANFVPEVSEQGAVGLAVQ